MAAQAEYSSHHPQELPSRNSNAQLLSAAVPHVSEKMSTILDNDDDSTFGSMATSTTSLTSSILDFPERDGRRYHAYKAGIYFLPNDDEEQTRLDLQHDALLLATGGHILHAPVRRCERILDLGTGTGQWALEMADLHPEAVVIGVDISPIQPDLVAPNALFQVFDVEDDWDWSEEFDVIYSSDMLMGSISDKERYFAQAFEYVLIPLFHQVSPKLATPDRYSRFCKSGGYFELHEVDIVDVRSDRGAVVPSEIQEWCCLMREGIRGFSGKTLDLTSIDIPELMRRAGFVDIVCKTFKIPLGAWPSDPVLKRAGLLQLCAMLHGLGGMSLAIFTRVHKWPLDMLELFLAELRRSLRTEEFLYLPWYKKAISFRKI